MPRVRHAVALLSLLSPILLATSSAPALEKTSARIDGYERPTDWNATNTINLRYYNNCTGWVWVWSGWSVGESMGVCFDAGGPVYLNTTWALTFSGIPAGWGFTGTISVHDGCDCSAPTLASQSWIPPITSGWRAKSWGGLPVRSPFFVNVAWGAWSGFTNGTGLATDRPAGGPTGPQSCGVCFPTTRTVRSRYFGAGGQVLSVGDRAERRRMRRRVDDRRERQGRDRAGAGQLGTDQESLPVARSSVSQLKRSTGRS